MSGGKRRLSVTHRARLEPHILRRPQQRHPVHGSGDHICPPHLLIIRRQPQHAGHRHQTGQCRIYPTLNLLFRIIHRKLSLPQSFAQLLAEGIEVELDLAAVGQGQQPHAVFALEAV